MRKLTKLEVVLLAMLLGLLLSGFTQAGGYLIMGLFETIDIACIGDHITVTDTGTVEYLGHTFFTGELSCWIITTQ